MPTTRPHRPRLGCTVGLIAAVALTLGACSDPRDETPDEPGFQNPSTMPTDITQAPRTQGRGAPSGTDGTDGTETTVTGAAPGNDAEDFNVPGGDTSTTNRSGLDGIPPEDG